MSKTLVIYYSRSGKTKKVAESIAKKLHADLQQIIDNKKRSGLFGFICSGRDAMNENLADIQEIHVNINDYDKIIIGTPVWASRIATPVLEFIKKQKNNIKEYSLFYTQGGPGDNKIESQLDKYLNTKPEIIVGIVGKDFKENTYEEKLKILV
ncbi:flavodoxin [Clostridium sediminicola]|uniref:flavodoxin family protein n=1 Tax=Clostridium sediminicola TaxID=3114879 RepID=UPI0031F255F5